MNKTLASVVVAFGLLAGCTPDGEGSAGSIPTTPSTTPTTPTTPTKSTPTTPAAWTACTNQARGYTISHPPGWHTAYECRFLDPQPLNIPPGTDGYFTAVMVTDGDTTFAQAVPTASDRFVTLVSREETTIGGRQAIRYETEATGEALLERGDRVYGYAINRAGRSFTVFTLKLRTAPQAGYEANKKIVDEAVRTVTFRAS